MWGVSIATYDERIKEIKNTMTGVLKCLKDELQFLEEGDFDTLKGFDGHLFNDVLKLLKKFHLVISQHLVAGALRGHRSLADWLAQTGYESAKAVAIALNRGHPETLKGLREFAQKVTDWPLLVSAPTDPAWHREVASVFEQIKLGETNSLLPKKQKGKRSASLYTPLNKWLSQIYDEMQRVREEVAALQIDADANKHAATEGIALPTSWTHGVPPADRAEIVRTVAGRYRAEGKAEIITAMLSLDDLQSANVAQWVEKVFMPRAALEAVKLERHPAFCNIYGGAKRNADKESRSLRNDSCDPRKINSVFRGMLKKEFTDQIKKLLRAKR